MGATPMNAFMNFLKFQSLQWSNFIINMDTLFGYKSLHCFTMGVTILKKLFGNSVYLSEYSTCALGGGGGGGIEDFLMGGFKFAKGLICYLT